MAIWKSCCLLFAIFAFLNPGVYFLPYSLYYIYTNPEEVYLGPEFWPKHGEQQDFFIHKYVYVNETLRGNPSNVTFHYIEAGDPSKETIVFTMGASEPALVYSYVMKDLVDDYHLISIDGKGFPYTSTHRSTKIDQNITDPAANWDPFFQGEEMVTALDKIGVKRFNLVSSDLQSIVTGFWVSEWPDRVIRYIRGQSHVGIQNYAAVPQGLFFKNFPRVAEGLLSNIRVIIWRIITGQFTATKWFDSEKRTTENFKMAPEFNEKIVRVLRSGSVVPWVYFWLHLPKPTLFHQLNKFKEITCPVLLIQGMEDKAQPHWFFDGSLRYEWPETVEPGVEELRPKLHEVPPEEVEQWKAPKYFPNSSWADLVWIEGAGHFPHFETPEEYTAQIKRFFRLTKDIV